MHHEFKVRYNNKIPTFLTYTAGRYFLCFLMDLLKNKSLLVQDFLNQTV